jgi:hypothetical protein
MVQLRWILYYLDTWIRIRYFKLRIRFRVRILTISPKILNKFQEFFYTLLSSVIYYLSDNTVNIFFSRCKMSR